MWYLKLDGFKLVLDMKSWVKIIVLLTYQVLDDSRWLYHWMMLRAKNMQKPSTDNEEWLLFDDVAY